MRNSINIIEEIIDRVREIIWWNRGLTKLNKKDYFRNYEDFIKNKLILIKGPYLEFVLPPKLRDINTRDFLRNLNFDERVIDTIIKVLFKNQNLYLYEHQARAIEAIIEGKNIILSVPTATGKTEAFFFPILDYCIKEKKNGLKALIIYPMKTLEIDQLNRFIKYLYVLNNYSKNQKIIKIGIWDGDTPNDVGNPDINPGNIFRNSYYRGLECPICNNKLRINDSGYLYCENHDIFNWIYATRERISNSKIDILISNPEAIDFLFISPEESKKGILGEYSSQYPLKYIIFDEIHTWTGLSGASIKLFIERLLFFYKNNDPQLILLSATVKNPLKLLTNFISSNNIESIEFTPISLNINYNVDFKNLSPCSFQELIKTYLYCYYVDKNRANLQNKFQNYNNIENTLIKLNLAQINGNELIISNEILASYFNVYNKELFDNHLKFDKLIDDVLNDFAFKQTWRELLLKYMPEIAFLINHVIGNSRNTIRFIEYDDLKQFFRINEITDENIDDILNMLLSFGRIGDLLSDRYHIFLKPRENIYWCDRCFLLLERKICECGNKGKLLKFCRKCHEIFFDIEDNISNGSIDLEYPYSGDLNKCPSCHQRIYKFYTLGIPYTAFISFLISATCRKLDSQKILIFSDGRGSAEKIADNIIEYDYKLIAEQILLRILIESGGTKNTRELYHLLKESLYNFYYNVYRDESLDDISKDIIDELRIQKINPLCNVKNFYYSFENAFITAKCIIELQNNIEMIIAHEFLKMFTSNFNNIQFRQNKILMNYKNRRGFTFEKIYNRFKKKFNFDENLIFRVLIYIFKVFLEKQLIREFSNNDIEDLINDNRRKNFQIKDQDIKDFKSYLNNQRAELQYFFKDYENIIINVGLFYFSNNEIDFDLAIVENIFFCLNCYVSYPIYNNKLDFCPICKSSDLYFGSRVRKYNDSKIIYKGLGFLYINRNWIYNIDHWGSDILKNAVDLDNEIKNITIAAHRAGYPFSLRGIIEEGFRKDPPKFNAISSTPTLELGIDIGTLDAICIVGIPPLLTNYIQRAGRTGRSIGKTSYIFNVIRNTHAIDNYYFNNLENYFKEFREIFIPNVKNFDKLYGAHIINIVCTYLARNPDLKNTYARIFKLSTTLRNSRNYFRQINTRFRLFLNLIRNYKRQELEKLIRDNFGQHALDIFNRMFFKEDDQLFLLKIAFEFFKKIRDIKTDPDAFSKFSEKYISFDWWLNLLNLIANYRSSFSINIPIFLEGRNRYEKQIEFKELERAVKETFPGPKNEDGALFRVESNRFIVSNVYGSNQQLNNSPIYICINLECYASFIPFINYANCPFCGRSLKPFLIHGINKIIARPSRRSGDHFETTPLMVISPESYEILKNNKIRFYNINSEIEYGKLKITKSTLAFLKKYRNSSESRFYFSQGIIENIEENFENDEYLLNSDIDLNLLNELEDSNNNFKPVGFNFQTMGINIKIKKTKIEEIIRYYINEYYLDDLDDFHTFFTLLYSIQQSLKKIISLYTESDLNEFDVFFTFSDDFINFYIIDNAEGGNGISKRVFNSLNSDNEIYSFLENGILNCKECLDFCDNCLLIERTPEYIVRKRLLNHNLLKYIYDFSQ
ncbi:MAG: DEAD/DEAH box helicase [Promethearchaeota archaeon]